MSAPDLSVVVATRAGWAPVSRTVRCLSEQTIADRIELVLVTFAPELVGEPPAAVGALFGHQVVPLPGARSVAVANAAGARRARADIVVFGEDHSFPMSGWAAALVERHREPWAVVGPVVRNANPGTLVSWADFVLGYGPFAEGHAGGEVEAAPGHNSAYKRAVLERHDAELEEALAAEWVFHGRLRDEGERIFLEPRAVTRHVNFGLPRAFATATFRGGQAGASVRARRWPRARRVAYALASPLIPLLRLQRTLVGLSPNARRCMPFIRLLPFLLMALAIDAAGQAEGFLHPADEPAPDGDLELERLRFVPEEERTLLP